MPSVQADDPCPGPAGCTISSTITMKPQGAGPCPTQTRYPTDGHIQPRPAALGSPCKVSVWHKQEAMALVPSSSSQHAWLLPVILCLQWD